MPEPTTGYLITVVLVSAAVTWTLRAAPYAVLAPLRRSALAPYLNAGMPAGVMIILVVNSLFSTAAKSPTQQPWIPLALATATTAAIHLWRHNLLLSILAGTGLYTALASTVFTP
ncbi:AzlD domain-containing protein [Streptomyces sp. DvalAA-19]|uniref:branched-chain amino acid transporter permease n=1 Tax=Streptomyces sp. DvalAA-19 TaxID=1839761 RepID=UPI00081B88FC|nr:AzlD domain-containing protein [Streptomyces sp. DvalAA-19]SCE00641.1 PEP-CTERM protein-sorting domain-containing protein [Streptomyces sp. DvalAA-19]